MLRRLLLYGGVALVILSFLAVMTSGPLLKRPTGPADDVSGLVSILEAQVLEEQWAPASDTGQQLQQAWELVARRIQFSTDREIMRRFGEDLARLQGAIISHDRQGALAQISALRYLWQQLGK